MELTGWQSHYQELLALLPRGVRQSTAGAAYFTGYSYGTLYDWDQYFEAITLFYAGYPCDYVKNAVALVLSRAEEGGFIPRTVPEHGGDSKPQHRVQFKPFLGQLLLLCRQVEGKINWLTPEQYEKLASYLRHWLFACDVKGAGLSVWHECEHTGMDNHVERAGERNGRTDFCQGVDLNCYLVREARAMGEVARLTGHAEDARQFDKYAEERADSVRRLLWDDRRGMFFDRDAETGKLIDVSYVGTFAPLWAGVATPQQATRLVREHLLNTEEFWRPYPLPALSAKEPGYVQGYLPGQKTTCCSWRAHTWMPTNYYVFQGLRRYGFAAEAKELADRTWQMFRRGPFSEYYTSESGIGTGLKPFWGWSCLALFFHAELQLQIDPTDFGNNKNAIGSMRKWLTDGDAHP